MVTIRPLYYSMVITVGLLSSGCQSITKLNGYKSPQDNASPRSCTPGVSLSNNTPPPVWYDNLVQCVQQNDYKNAAVSYLFAGTYSWYDAGVVNTRYARSRHSVMVGETLSRLNEQQKKKLWGTLESTMDDNIKKGGLHINKKYRGAKIQTGLYFKKQYCLQ